MNGHFRVVVINDEISFIVRKHRHVTNNKPYSVLISAHPLNGAPAHDLYSSETSGKRFESEAMAITWGLYKILDPGELVELLITLKNENLQTTSPN